MPFKQTRVPKYLIMESPPRKPGWPLKIAITLAIALGLGLAYYQFAG